MERQTFTHLELNKQELFNKGGFKKLEMEGWIYCGLSRALSGGEKLVFRKQNIIIKLPPKFCNVCGKALMRTEKGVEFDIHTGEPTRLFKYKCPENTEYQVGLEHFKQYLSY